MATTTQDYIEHVTTPLHACSLESLPQPIETPDGSVWPLVLGCYQLFPEEEGHGGARRQGQLDLYSIRVPDDEDHCNDQDSLPLSLGSPTTVVKEDSGILDGKWTCGDSTYYYATAQATGDIQLYQLMIDNSNNHQDDHSSKASPLEMIRVGQTPSQDSICLAVAWNNPSSSSSSSMTESSCTTSFPKKLVSSYSNGHVAIHNVRCVSAQVSDSNSNALPATTTSTTTATLELVESWSAHQMFQNPAEVWAACFQTNHDEIVLTGGDEGQLKLWDIRTGTTRPVQSLAKTFEAGVTVLSPHLRNENWIAAGSYDETMALLDLRFVATGSSSSSPRLLYHSDPLGGGLWKIKWHPSNDTRLLVAAMHGGCRVVDLEVAKEEEEARMNLHIHQHFTHHQSMAYGADWLVHSSPRRRNIQAAVSCSFYDQAMYLWNVHDS